MITFDEFQNVELRTARVLSAREHPDADRLLLLQIDVGDLGERQIVAGIRGHYEPEALVGRTIVIVANLEPAKLRGETSEGMLLAVRDGDAVRLVGPDEVTGPGLEVS